MKRKLLFLSRRAPGECRENESADLRAGIVATEPRAVRVEPVGRDALTRTIADLAGLDEVL